MKSSHYLKMEEIFTESKVDFEAGRYWILELETTAPEYYEMKEDYHIFACVHYLCTNALMSLNRTRTVIMCKVPLYCDPRNMHYGKVIHSECLENLGCLLVQFQRMYTAQDDLVVLDKLDEAPIKYRNLPQMPVNRSCGSLDDIMEEPEVPRDTNVYQDIPWSGSVDVRAKDIIERAQNIIDLTKSE